MIHNTVKTNILGLAAVISAYAAYFVFVLKPEFQILLDGQPVRACHLLMDLLSSLRLAITFMIVSLVLVHFIYIYQKAITQGKLVWEKFFLLSKFNITREFLVAVFNGIMVGLVILLIYLVEILFDCAQLS